MNSVTGKRASQMSESTDATSDDVESAMLSSSSRSGTVRANSNCVDAPPSRVDAEGGGVAARSRTAYKRIPLPWLAAAGMSVVALSAHSFLPLAVWDKDSGLEDVL